MNDIFVVFISPLGVVLYVVSPGVGYRISSRAVAVVQFLDGVHRWKSLLKKDVNLDQTLPSHLGV